MGKHAEKKSKSKNFKLKYLEKRTSSVSSSSSFYSSSHVGVEISSSSSSSTIKKKDKKSKKSKKRKHSRDHNGEQRLVAVKTKEEKQAEETKELELRNRLLNNIQEDTQAIEVYSLFKKVNYMDIPNIYNKL
jgi:hypothetical protein